MGYDELLYRGQSENYRRLTHPTLISSILNRVAIAIQYVLT